MATLTIEERIYRALEQGARTKAEVLDVVAVKQRPTRASVEREIDKLIPASKLVEDTQTQQLSMTQAVIDSRAALKSRVTDEQDLYPHVLTCLKNRARASHDIHVDISWARKPGLWENPDILEVSTDYSPHFDQYTHHVVTYEVKQFPWRREGVPEADSHGAKANEVYLVLEWPTGLDADVDNNDYFGRIHDEARRRGVGLAVLKFEGSQWSLQYLLNAEHRTPPLSDVFGYLEYIEDKKPTTDLKILLENARKQAKEAKSPAEPSSANGAT
jgi:hypothetical protein